MADVKDLLIRMSLDTADFKKNIADANKEIKTLKAEFKAAASGDDVENVGKALLDNLQQQKTAAEALVKEYEGSIEKIRTELDKAPAGSQKASRLQSDIQKMETGLANAKTYVNELQTKIDGFKLDRFIETAQTVASTINSLRLGLRDLLGGAGETADSADKVYVSREAAFTTATKNVDEADSTDEKLKSLNNGLREMTTRIPRTYEQLADLLRIGATLHVPYEHLLNFVEVMAKLNTATNVDGESGAQDLAQFLNITEKHYGNLDRVGATLTELGNNSATTEQAILEMAHRAATGLSTVGMSTADILALSAAINSVGIEAQAGGSSISKLGITMDKAAKVGATQIESLLEAGRTATGVAYSSIYDLYASLDADGGKAWREMEAVLGMTASDSKALMNSALAAERFSQAMGMTVDQFSAGWRQDSANTMLSFFRALGSMDGTESGENMLWVMDQLGIKEIRQSNMVRALANNWELYANMLTLGRNAYQENIALENEAQRAFGTTESQRAMNANKEQNALEAMGQTVTAMRKPFDDFFADLKQWYAEWPSWAQTAVAGAAEAMGAAGNVLDTTGRLAFDVLNIANAVKQLRESALGAKLLSGAKTAGKAALGVGAAGLAAWGFVELAEYMGNIADQTDKISAGLKDIKINIDSQSKKETLDALAEVQAAKDRLRGLDSETAARYASTSQVVQMGYGTASMFGTALGYEMTQGEAAISAVYERYGAQIREEEKKLLAATSETDRAAAQQRIEQLTQSMEQEAGAARTQYGETLNRLLLGAIEQTDSKEALQRAGEKWDLLQAVYEGWADYKEHGNDAFTSSGAKAALQARLQEAGLSLFDKRGNMDFTQAISGVYGQMAEDVKQIVGDQKLMSIFAAAFEAGAFDNADQDAFSGAVLGFFQAMDIKQIGEQGAKDWREIGRDSMLGLGQGITDAQGNPIGAAQGASTSVIDAAKTVFNSHSPSLVFEGIGMDLDAGLAQGILAGIPDTVSAVQALGQAVAAEAQRQASLIAAAMTVIAPAPRYAAGGAENVSSGAAARGGNTVNNTYNFTGATPAQTQGVKALARELTNLQKRANASYGQI